MKKYFTAMLIALCAVVLSAAEPAEPASVPGGPAEQSECAAAENFRHLGRGAANLVTCFLEVPRCMLLRNSEVPFWGTVSGAFEGVGCTGMRAFAGAADVLSLGFDAGRVYTPAFREYVWQSRWLPESK